MRLKSEIMHCSFFLPEKWAFVFLSVVSSIPLCKFVTANLSILSLINIWVTYKFRLLWIKWLWIFLCKYFFLHLFLFLWINPQEWNYWAQAWCMLTGNCSSSSSSSSSKFSSIYIVFGRLFNRSYSNGPTKFWKAKQNLVSYTLCF